MGREPLPLEGGTNARIIVEGLFAGLALLLALAGIYGVIAYSVARCSRELGIRMALAADRGRVLGLVLRHAARLALAGILIGLAATLAAGRITGRLLHGVSALDPLYLAGVAGLLFVLVLVATLVPARRATTVDPVRPLRTS